LLIADPHKASDTIISRCSNRFILPKPPEMREYVVGTPGRA
jgi:hypothetical protein